MLDFCQVEFEDGSQGMINVAEFTADVLQEEGIWFSFPAFAKTFNRIIELQDEYFDEQEMFFAKIENEKKDMLKAGYDEIASKNLNMTEIRRAERLLEDQIQEEMANRSFDFARYFVEQKLLSHHDDEVRRTVNEAINSEQPLSNIYLRNNPVSERKMDLDRMHLLVPRNMMEWKNEMLNLTIKSKMRQLNSLLGGANSELEQKILLEIQALMEKRGHLAKSMGERTIGKKIK